MNRFWELIISAKGIERFYCFPFLLLFKLITPFYQAISRRQLRRRRLRCSGGWKAKVISVGNISVGGTGKSPIVMWLAQRFIDRGSKVVIVHSGFGRAINEDIVVDYGKGADYSHERVGDEVAMMIKLIPRAAFTVGRDKKNMVRLADQKLNPDVILIDDGFQRLDIKKDVDIIVLSRSLFEKDSGGGLERNLRLFPGGILRESFKAIGRGDAVFGIGIEGEPEGSFQSELRRYNKKAPTVGWTFSFAGVEYEGEVKSLDILSGRRPFLFAGIGSYSRLPAMVRKAGIEPAGEYGFGDHHDYDKSDFRMLREMSNSYQADCYLTTAKDLIKFQSSVLDKPVFCLHLKVEPEQPQQVDEIVGLGGS